MITQRGSLPQGTCLATQPPAARASGVWVFLTHHRGALGLGQSRRFPGSFCESWDQCSEDPGEVPRWEREGSRSKCKTSHLRSGPCCPAAVRGSPSAGVPCPDPLLTCRRVSSGCAVLSALFPNCIPAHRHCLGWGFFLGTPKCNFDVSPRQRLETFSKKSLFGTSQLSDIPGQSASSLLPLLSPTPISTFP